MNKIVVAFGTRPEVIKLAPVIHALKKTGKDIKVLHTGQHLDLAAPMFTIFDIRPDVNLEVMKENQTLFELSASLLPAVGDYLRQEKPHAVVIQGDTTTAYLTALAAFYLKIPVFHVEAGLRSHNPYYPFPEEVNRKLISQIAATHFAPTKLNAKNLKDEGIQEDRIIVTGNTIIDSLNYIRENEKFLQQKPALLKDIEDNMRVAVLTAHRRENHGKPLQEILSAANELIQEHENLLVVYPAHPSPAVQEAINNFKTKNNRFHITRPLDYVTFLHLMLRSDLILTDSGGIQEEASALGKPVVVLRNETERQELIDSGFGKLAGTNKGDIIHHSNNFLKNTANLKPQSLFGDGRAAERITKALMEK